MSRDGFDVSRRGFSKGAAALGAASAATLTGAGGFTAMAAQNAGAMPLRPFGKTGVKVPILSMGGMYDTVNNQMVMAAALRLGVTYWDTAESYGHGVSETGMGRFFARNPGVRQKVFLVSKGYTRDLNELSSMLDGSLKRLQTNYIDLYFLHSIGDPDEITPELGRWAGAAKKSGKIKLFGVSTHSNMAACLMGAAKAGFIDGIMFTYNFRIMHQAEMQRGIEACHKAGVGLTAMKTQGGGQVRIDSEAELRLAGRFVKRGFSDGQAKLKAVWEDKRIAAICSQMPNLSLLMSNAAAALDKTKLTATDHDLLRQMAVQTRAGYCAGCSAICQKALGTPAPVNEVLRALMYLDNYNDPQAAREAFAALDPRGLARLAALDLAPAEAACPQGLPLRSLVSDALARLA